MEANRVMSLTVITVPPELPLEAAHRIMLDHGVRHLPVVAGALLAGILSDRDVLWAAQREGDGADERQPVTVGEAMSLAPVSGGPNTPVSALAKAMVDARVDALPIVTKQNVLVGLVTSSDLLRVLSLLPSEPQPTLDFQVRRAAELQAKA
ncbi:MAG: CBS domain-containing protein [Myxococcaceae bacterium]|jgi:acetoin utilization protein AcuB|nr:CBS domain-containing protein [Myxococcaceae bacterium]